MTLCSAVPNSAADHLREILGVSKPDDPPKMHKLLRKQMHEVRTEDEESMEFSEVSTVTYFMSELPLSPKCSRAPHKLICFILFYFHLADSGSFLCGHFFEYILWKFLKFFQSSV